MKKQAVCRAAALCAGLGIVGGVAAAAMPFYGQGSATPSREPASSAASTSVVPLDSRVAQTAESPAVKFNSDGAKGLFIVVR